MTGARRSALLFGLVTAGAAAAAAAVGSAAVGCAVPVFEDIELGPFDAGSEGPAELSRWSGQGTPRAPAEALPPLERMPCPEEAIGHEAALNAADRFYEAADLPAALACAELAADFAPQAVEAHHLRGAALATMGRASEAQTAFSMALALDPDDPETLAAASDFYINVVNPRGRDQLLLGLEYARRGAERAATRRRSDRQLRARLALLVGAGLNDLGSSDLALRQIEESLALSPGWLEAIHEKGVALFNVCRFDEAEAAFKEVLLAAPADPYANFYLGLVSERLERAEEATRYFAAARDSSPGEYFKHIEMTDAEFRAELDEVISELSVADKAILAAVKLEVSALPLLEDLKAVEPPFAPTITGLYRGLPVGVSVEGWTGAAGHASSNPSDPTDSIDALTHLDGAIPPRAIVLYRANLIRGARTRAELDAQVRRTLLHELGHAKGLDEDELRRIGLE